MKLVVALVPALALASGIASAAPPATTLEGALLGEARELHPEALRAALASWDALDARGEVHRPLLAVIDYGLPSTEKRLWVFDVTDGRLLFNELVAHGRNSGENDALRFSNEDGSYMSSLGAFVTGSAYDGHNGYSLRLKGFEPAVNDHAEERAIVLHGAPYVSDALIQSQGRLGRSLG